MAIVGQSAVCADREVPALDPACYFFPPRGLLTSFCSPERVETSSPVRMSSYGTLGLQAIKAVGGLSAAQEPKSAQFDSMPSHAIDSTLVDIVADPGALPGRILSYVRGIPESPEARVDPAPSQQEIGSAHERIIEITRKHTGHDFTPYKPSTLHRRTERRMAIHGLATLDLYADYLDKNPHEIDLLFKELLIGVTNFFRDPAVWEHIEAVALPELLERRKPGEQLRAWTVGCSTGEEAYSFAILFSELISSRPEAESFTLQIFASDVSPDAIAAARRGQFPLSIRNHVSADRLEKCFSSHEDYYQIDQNIRDMVLFAQHDVVLDPAFTRLDVILCRNLLIYFSAELQRRILPLFHYALRPGGVLVLGASETTGRFSHLFKPLHAKMRLYQREDTEPVRRHDLLLPSHPPIRRKQEESVMTAPEAPKTPNDGLKAAADEALLQVYAPAAVLVNAGGDIVYISGRTGRYLEPAAGKANWNINAMARGGLREVLGPALKRAVPGSESVHLNGVEIRGSEGVLRVDVTVQTFDEPAALHGMVMIVFRDLPMRIESEDGDPTGPVDQEPLQHAHEEIQRLREEARTNRGALHSTNEQLQSTNEELQSTNEELTTSKEEMQSMNDELQTINAELQTKLDDLAMAQSDMQNVLNSVEIAILFLDNDLHVRRYTDRTTSVVSLRESDLGRPLSDLTMNLQYPGLYKDARETLETLRPSEKQIPSNDDRWFSVRIMPYRRIDNRIDGVVITLFDITATKNLEAALRESAGD